MSESQSASIYVNSEWDKDRLFLIFISFAVSLAVIVVINLASASNPAVAKGIGTTLVDFQLQTDATGQIVLVGPNIWAPQNFMWVAFFFGLADLLYRSRWVKKEMAEMSMAYLPEDDRTLLTSRDLPAIYRKVRTADRGLFLPRLIARIIVQFQKSNSVDQSSSLLNTSLDLYLHELDLRYTVIRYTNWIIPTLGFLGTVIGIAMALSYAGSPASEPNTLLSETTLRLGVAFYTTGVALVMSGILVLAMNLVQAAEERVLNRCGQYCLDNLINKLFEQKS